MVYSNEAGREGEKELDNWFSYSSLSGLALYVLAKY